MSWAVVFLVVLAVAGVALWRGQQLRQLVARGVPVTGRVERKLRTGKARGMSKRKRVVFVYTGPDGREYRRAATVTTSAWERYAEGGPIALVCLPDDPGVSAEATLVDSARAALNKRASGG